MKLYTKLTNEWNTWFAWYPVATIEGNVVWLENVYRKYEHAKIDNVKPSSWAIYKLKK